MSSVVDDAGVGNDDRDFVRALARGLSVIECFDGNHARMNLSEIAARSGLSRGTARRLLITLESLGYVGLSGSRFSLRPRILRLGYAYLASEPLWTQARVYLEDVNRETGETCSIAVLDQTEIVFVARVAAKRLVQDYISVEFRWPAYATSLGRVLLSALSNQELDRYFAAVRLDKHTDHTITDEKKLRSLIYQAREQGWSSADREMELGLRSVAVPIFGSDRRIIAAMNTNAQAHKADMKMLEAGYVPVLQRAAERVSDMLATRGEK